MGKQSQTKRHKRAVNTSTSQRRMPTITQLQAWLFCDEVRAWAKEELKLTNDLLRGMLNTLFVCQLADMDKDTRAMYIVNGEEKATIAINALHWELWLGDDKAMLKDFPKNVFGEAIREETIRQSEAWNSNNISIKQK